MKKIYLDYKSSGKLVRAALVDDGRLEELLIYKKDTTCETGDIFVGKVKNILPGLFVYIDIGLDKNAFLGLNDRKEADLFDERGKLKIKQGDDILVQIIKNPSGIKGANVTTQINYSNKYAIVFESADNRVIGISKKIEDIKERERLKSVAKKILPDGVSVIIRTICENRSNEEITEKIVTLINDMSTIKERAKYVKSPALIVRKTSFISDLYTDGVEQIVADDVCEMENILKELDEVNCQSADVKIYSGHNPIFKEFFLESQVSRIMNKKVWLKSGAFIIIERTEACYVIDVNTGKNVGKNTYKDMVFKTNMEAAYEIAKQIRLRNLSGMIIVDFIDMHDESDRREVEEVFGEELRKDRISANLISLNILGLAVVTRKKTREPVFELMTKECSVCRGTGRIMEE